MALACSTNNTKLPNASMVIFLFHICFSPLLGKGLLD